MNRIEAKDLYKQFGREQVLRGVSVTVQPGEILGVLGPSGSGKTTLVKCMIGILSLNGGSVRVDGVPMPNLKQMDAIGYMAQQDALYEDLSGLQNLVFYGRLKAMSKKDALRQALSLLVMVDLLKDKDKKVIHYSGGMKRRLSLTAALIGNPGVIVLDEPTVGIDPVLRELFWQEFRRLKSLGKTIIVTTHVMDEAEKCDRLILLRDGRIIEDGTPQTLKAKTPEATIESIFLRASLRQPDGGERI